MLEFGCRTTDLSALSLASENQVFILQSSGLQDHKMVVDCRTIVSFLLVMSFKKTKNKNLLDIIHNLPVQLLPSAKPVAENLLIESLLPLNSFLENQMSSKGYP